MTWLDGPAPRRPGPTSDGDSVNAEIGAAHRRQPAPAADRHDRRRGARRARRRLERGPPVPARRPRDHAGLVRDDLDPGVRARRAARDRGRGLQPGRRRDRLRVHGRVHAGLGGRLLVRSCSTASSTSCCPPSRSSLGTVAVLSRYQRSAMLDVLGADFVRTAMAKGLRRRTALLKHALRTALIPAATYFAFSFGLLLVGAAFVEKIFGWHGMGEFFVDSVTRNEVNAVAAGSLFAADAGPDRGPAVRHRLRGARPPHPGELSHGRPTPTSCAAPDAGRPGRCAAAGRDPGALALGPGGPALLVPQAGAGRPGGARRCCSCWPSWAPT